MKKRILTAMICAAIFLCLAGAKCTESDQLMATQMALGSVEIGYAWGEAKAMEKWVNGEWSDEDYNYWFTRRSLEELIGEDEISRAEMAKLVLTKNLPWLIKKLSETTTAEERKELAILLNE